MNYALLVVKVVVSQGGVGIVALVIAIIGVVLAAGSLLWQWFSYRLGGPRLRVEIKKGYVGMGQLVSSPIDVDADAQMLAQGYTDRYVGAEVKNIGRLPISIDRVEAKADCGVSVLSIDSPVNPVSGFRIESHSSASWWVPWSSVQAAVIAYAAVRPEWNKVQAVRMVVNPATGRKITTKRSIEVWPS